MKNSAGEESVMKFLGCRKGFHRVFSIDDSASKYAPLIGYYSLMRRRNPGRWLANINYLIGRDMSQDFWFLIIIAQPIYIYETNRRIVLLLRRNEDG